MFKRFFDTTEIRALAREIVADLQQVLPAGETEARTRKAEDRLAKLDLKVARRIAELNARGELNFYKKAKLGSLVLDALGSAGYPAEFSKRYVTDLVSLAATAVARR
jgi:hypothetical protein